MTDKDIKNDNVFIWFLMIPICIIAIYCFVEGFIFSFERAASQFNGGNAGGGVVILGLFILFIPFMSLMNILVHIGAGIRVFRNKLPEFSKDNIFHFKNDSIGSMNLIKLLSNGFIVVYIVWFIYGIFEGNFAYLVWNLLAIAVTLYYKWCFTAQKSISE